MNVTAGPVFRIDRIGSSFGARRVNAERNTEITSSEQPQIKILGESKQATHRQRELTILHKLIPPLLTKKMLVLRYPIGLCSSLRPTPVIAKKALRHRSKVLASDIGTFGRGLVVAAAVDCSEDSKGALGDEEEGFIDVDIDVEGKQMPCHGYGTRTRICGNTVGYAHPPTSRTPCFTPPPLAQRIRSRARRQRRHGHRERAWHADAQLRPREYHYQQWIGLDEEQDIVLVLSE